MFTLSSVHVCLGLCVFPMHMVLWMAKSAGWNNKWVYPQFCSLCVLSLVSWFPFLYPSFSKVLLLTIFSQSISFLNNPIKYIVLVLLLFVERLRHLRLCFCILHNFLMCVNYFFWLRCKYRHTYGREGGRERRERMNAYEWMNKLNECIFHLLFPSLTKCPQHTGLG